MSSCCEEECTGGAKTGFCTLCLAQGARVEVTTVKALLTETALRRFTPGEYWFCPDATCSVVYFDESGQKFTRGDIRVPVWHKEPFGTRMVCYCFGENEADIGAEIASQGRSDAVARVTAHIRADRCACEIRNPRGRCCLGDIVAAVKRVAADLESGADV